MFACSGNQETSANKRVKKNWTCVDCQAILKKCMIIKIKFLFCSWNCFFCSRRVVTHALFRHKSQLKWNFSALPSLLCKLHKIVNFVFGWVRNIAKIKIVPLCSIGYSIIHLFRLFVICLQSSLSLSYLFKLLEQRLFLS